MPSRPPNSTPNPAPNFKPNAMPPATTKPMADALRPLKAQAQIQAQAQGQVQSPSQHAANASRATQPPGTHLARTPHASSDGRTGTRQTRQTRDPLATIEQPVNAPLPKPMASALADWRAAQAPTPAAQPATPAPSAKQPAPEPDTPFAELMRQQARGPQPAALRDKLALDATGRLADDMASPMAHGLAQGVSGHSTFNTLSTAPSSSKNKRKDPYTAFFDSPNSSSKRTSARSSAYTAPPGFTGSAGTHTPGQAPAQLAQPVGALSELKAIQTTLRKQQAQARQAQAAQQTAQRERHAARAAFERAVGPVHALPDDGKVLHHQPREPVPMQRLLDEQAVLRESLSDEFNAGTLLETDEQLSFLRPGVGLDVARKLRLGEWSIQGQVGLHGLRIDAAREALGSFIRESHQQGLRCVRVIHGKGLGSPGKTPVLKSRVLRWLVQKAEVMAYVQANPNQGGHGAIVVLLRASRR